MKTIMKINLKTERLWDDDDIRNVLKKIKSEIRARMIESYPEEGFFDLSQPMQIIIKVDCKIDARKTLGEKEND